MQGGAKILLTDTMPRAPPQWLIIMSNIYKNVCVIQKKYITPPITVQIPIFGKKGEGTPGQCCLIGHPTYVPFIAQTLNSTLLNHKPQRRRPQFLLIILALIHRNGLQYTQATLSYLVPRNKDVSFWLQLR